MKDLPNKLPLPPPVVVTLAAQAGVALPANEAGF